MDPSGVQASYDNKVIMKSIPNEKHISTPMHGAYIRKYPHCWDYKHTERNQTHHNWYDNLFIIKSRLFLILTLGKGVKKGTQNGNSRPDKAGEIAVIDAYKQEDDFL